MRKNLKTADEIVKLILAMLVLIFYFTHVISGPLALALTIVAVIVIIIFIARMLLTIFLTD